MKKGDYIKQVLKNTKEYKEEPEYLFPDFGEEPLPECIAPSNVMEHQKYFCDKVKESERCFDPALPNGYQLNCIACMFDPRNTVQFIEWLEANQKP